MVTLRFVSRFYYHLNRNYQPQEAEAPVRECCSFWQRRRETEGRSEMAPIVVCLAAQESKVMYDWRESRNL